MTTPLSKPLKREVLIKGRAFIVTLSAEGIKVVLKGKRNGQELRWEDLVSGEAALAVALIGIGRQAYGRRAPPSPIRPQSTLMSSQQRIPATFHLCGTEIFLPREQHPYVAVRVADAGRVGAVEHVCRRLNLFGSCLNGTAE